MNYREKLLDPRWQKKRLQVLSRDRFACQNCLDKTKTLQVHHRFYQKDSDPWEVPKKYLVTLCGECHKNVKQIDFKTLWKKRLKIRIAPVVNYIPDFVIRLVFKIFKLKHI